MGKSFIGLLEHKIYRIESIFFAHENWAFLQHPKQSHTSAIWPNFKEVYFSHLAAWFLVDGQEHSAWQKIDHFFGFTHRRSTGREPYPNGVMIPKTNGRIQTSWCPVFMKTLTIWGFLCENTRHGFSPMFFFCWMWMQHLSFWIGLMEISRTPWFGLIWTIKYIYIYIRVSCSFSLKTIQCLNK